jgi:hypothetical protein
MISILFCYIEAFSANVEALALFDKYSQIIDCIPDVVSTQYKDTFLLVEFIHLNHYLDMDSNYSKHSYSYDSTGKLTQVEIKGYKHTSTGIYPDTIIRFEYNENNQLINKISSYWDLSEQSWVNSTKITNFYNGEKLIIESIYYIWNNFDFTWINDLKVITSYDNNGNDTFITIVSWDTVNNDWRETAAIQKQYDIYSNLSSNIKYYQNNNSDEWINYSKTDFKYVEGMKIELVYSLWDFSMNKWNARTKSTYDYDNFKNIVLETSTVFDTISYEWVNSSRTTHLYIDQLYMGYLFEAYQNSEQAWINSSKLTKEYGTDNLLQNEYAYAWNEVDSNWMEWNVDKYEYQAFTIDSKWNSQLSDNLKPIFIRFDSNILRTSNECVLLIGYNLKGATLFRLKPADVNKYSVFILPANKLSSSIIFKLIDSSGREIVKPLIQRNF